MKIIKIIPSKKSRGSWCVFEAPGVEPTYKDKQQAITYGKGRFGGSDGEVHVYNDAGDAVVEKIPVNDRGLYPHTSE